MKTSIILGLGVIGGIHVLIGVAAGPALKPYGPMDSAAFLKENKDIIAAFSAVMHYAFYGGNPEAVTGYYQDLARKVKWLETIEFSKKTEGHYANVGKELNKLPSRFAAVKGNTKEAVIAKQKTIHANLVLLLAAELEHEGSHDQNMLELSSFFAKILKAYIKFHSEDDRNENNDDRVEPY